jgi:sulfhydrogenase subunit beta (sulfur reductase)
MQYKHITKEEWDKTLEQLLLSFTIFAGIEDEFGQDYELIKPENIACISYNKPKPATSLKHFFLPIKENVTSDRTDTRPRVIIGVPNCDISALSLLDEIYLDKDFNDIFYRKRRENTILISSDCFGIQEHCHCLSYDVKPYSLSNADLSVIHIDGTIILRIITPRGEKFTANFPAIQPLDDKSIIETVEKKHQSTENLLQTANRSLPDYKNTGELVTRAEMDVWEKYSGQCVSCGACTTICPTCTCFLLIDKPGFEKVKQMDACQYPGFGRVAGGEDALFELHNRFRNRYMCKYSWKPDKFNSIACTGCGRCIEACIGKINKNEIFIELAKQPVC